MTDASAPSPAQVAALLESFDGPWWIGGGVALDLFLGTTPRAEGCIEVVVLADHWPSLASVLHGWDLRSGPRSVSARSGTDQPWAIEFLLAQRVGDDWVHPEHAEVTLPLTELGLATPDGIPYVRPEVVLLQEADEPDAPEHEADLATSLPKLGIGPRCWLAGALDLARPGHPWIARVL